MVDLYGLEKRKMDLIHEYDLGVTALNRWINQEKKSGAFQTKDNLTP